MQVAGFNAQNLENAELLRSGQRKAVNGEKQKVKSSSRRKTSGNGIKEDNEAAIRNPRTLDVIKAGASRAVKK